MRITSLCDCWKRRSRLKHVQEYNYSINNFSWHTCLSSYGNCSIFIDDLIDFLNIIIEEICFSSTRSSVRVWWYFLILGMKERDKFGNENMVNECVSTDIYIYIYIYIQGCLFSSEATGGPPGHRWPPQKTVAPLIKWWLLQIPT